MSKCDHSWKKNRWAKQVFTDDGDFLFPVKCEVCDVKGYEYYEWSGKVLDMNGESEL